MTLWKMPYRDREQINPKGEGSIWLQRGKKREFTILLYVNLKKKKQVKNHMKEEEVSKTINTGNRNKL